MFLPKNHPSVLRLPKHFVFALATLTGRCYSACYKGHCQNPQVFLLEEDMDN